VATPVKTSHTHGQYAARVRELVEGVGSVGSFDSMFTEFETHAVRAYSQRTPKGALKKMLTISNRKFALSLETLLSRR